MEGPSWLFESLKKKTKRKSGTMKLMYPGLVSLLEEDYKERHTILLTILFCIMGTLVLTMIQNSFLLRYKFIKIKSILEPSIY